MTMMKKKRIHKKIISMSGKSSCPNFTSNGNIIFASDYEDRSSRICFFDSSTDEVKCLTNFGYCVAPAYCKVNNKIVYCKKQQGAMQLMLYDLATDREEQLTFDSGDKIDPSWSPCGNYVAFCLQSNNLRRIAILNIKTKKAVFITADKDVCSYPAWSSQCDD